MKYLSSCAKSALLVGLPLLSVWYLWQGYKVAPALLFLSAFALIVTPNVRRPSIEKWTPESSH
jgi:hypothetical protein